MAACSSEGDPPDSLITGNVRPFQWTKAIRAADPAVLPRGPKALAFLMGTYADASDGGNCRPGDRRLAAELGVSVRTIKRWRACLVDHGWLRQMRRGLSAGQAGGSGRAAI